MAHSTALSTSSQQVELNVHETFKLMALLSGPDPFEYGFASGGLWVQSGTRAAALSFTAGLDVLFLEGCAVAALAGELRQALTASVAGQQRLLRAEEAGSDWSRRPPHPFPKFAHLNHHLDVQPGCPGPSASFKRPSGPPRSRHRSQLA